MNQALLIFIKNAEKGKVKTRLAATMGNDMALKIYIELLNYTRKITSAVDANRLLFYSNFIEEEDAWDSAEFQKSKQAGENLGARMQQAFEQAFQTNDKVLIIGSDCATLTSALINQAFQALEEHPFVLGPATDGGYYLLGMNSFQPSVFEGIEWSTASVAQETIKRFEALGKSYQLLPELSDIDLEEDWKKYGWPV